MKRWLFVSIVLAPVGVGAADVPERLQIFGHLTQAYGQSERGTIQGASEDGTTDLRKIAIQFRWTVSEDDTVVVQLSHERLGDDLFRPKDDEVEVDWAFFERRLGMHSTIKVGRLNVPLGIYNEIRDVGTLLPFFNLPISFYSGVLSTAETVDGLSISRSFWPRSEWSLDAELYLGGWDTFQQQVAAESDFGIANRPARAEDGFGVQLWLDTPARGLRVGAGALTWLLDGPLSVGGGKDRWDAYHLSVDASGERWVFRAEGRLWRFDQDFGAFLHLPESIPGKAEREGYYCQLGYWATEEIGIFAQFEEAGLGDNLDLLSNLDDFHKEMALSVNYRFRPDLLVKLEYHTAETQFPLGDPSLPIAVGAPPVDVDWALVGLSVSF